MLPGLRMKHFNVLAMQKWWARGRGKKREEFKMEKEEPQARSPQRHALPKKKGAGVRMRDKVQKESREHGRHGWKHHQHGWPEYYAEEQEKKQKKKIERKKEEEKKTRTRKQKNRTREKGSRTGEKEDKEKKS